MIHPFLKTTTMSLYLIAYILDYKIKKRETILKLKHTLQQPKSFIMNRLCR